MRRLARAKIKNRVKTDAFRISRGAVETQSTEVLKALCSDRWQIRTARRVKQAREFIEGKQFKIIINC